MRKSLVPGSARSYVGEFRTRVVSQSRQVPDPFGVNPIRRSFIGAVGSLATITIPFAISEQLGSSVMLSVGWLALATLVFSVPILIWSIGEWIVITIDRRLHPAIDELELPIRVIHILHRHGVHTIRDIDRQDDPTLMLMSNMEPRDVDAIRRAASLWHYRRWQEAGFPASGAD